PALPPIAIERVDDDYFLRARVSVSAGPAAGRLLAPGELLELSPRCRLTFQLPSAASTSAALDLTGARLPRSDVRRIILMDRDLVVGPSSAAHVTARELAENVVLHLSGDQLFCQSRGPLLIDGQPA